MQYRAMLDFRPDVRGSFRVPLRLLAKLALLRLGASPNFSLSADREDTLQIAARYVMSRYSTVHSSGKEGLSVSCTAALYSAFACGFVIDTEIFSDAINLSGVFPNFCSAQAHDVAFCSCGKWIASVDSSIESGAANLPYANDVIHDMPAVFDRNVVRSE